MLTALLSWIKRTPPTQDNPDLSLSGFVSLDPMSQRDLENSRTEVAKHREKYFSKPPCDR